MNGTPLRLETTTTMSPCEIIRLETKTFVHLLHENQEFADYFLTIFWRGPPESKRTWWTNCSIPAIAAGTSSSAVGQLWQ